MPSNDDLTGKKAFVCAASRGLGFAVARALCQRGADVFITGRDADRLERAAEELRALGRGRVATGAGDLGSSEDLDRMIAQAADELGPIDLLVTNSGGPPVGGASDIEDAVWKEWFDRLFLAPVRLSRAFLPGMRERGFGRILLIASSTAIEPLPRMAVSNALRGALATWAKTLAAEEGRHGITVNLLIPGRIDTDRVRELDQIRALRDGCSPEDVRNGILSEIPLGRYGTPEEFGEAAAFMCSAGAAYMTGGAIRIDGGRLNSI